MGDRHDMSVEQIISYVRQKGVVLIPDGDRIRYKAPSGIMTPDLVETIRAHKRAILGALSQSGEAREAFHRNHELKPGECNQCPAAGYWDFMGAGKWCFHTAYFLGRAGKPTPCKTAQHNCPLRKHSNKF
jgi:hypothetical protein